MTSKITKIKNLARREGLVTAFNAMLRIALMRLNRFTDRLLVLIASVFTRGRALEQVIVIESHNDFDCNGGSFYEYLLREGKNHIWTIVWLVRNDVPVSLPDNVEAYHLYGPSWKKACRICLAKYFLFDQAIIPKVRKEQVSIYCSHGGVTFKNVKGIMHAPTGVDYYLSPSINYDPIVCENYSIPYPNNQMLHLGYPINDTLLNCNVDEIEKVASRAGRKAILWMPTFRSIKHVVDTRCDSSANQPLGIPLVDSSERLDDLNTYLKLRRLLLIVKIHPFQNLETMQGLHSCSNIVVIDGNMAKKLDVDVYRLMASSDAMISDYSSSAYTFLLLNRPLAFSLEDFKDYKPGFVVSDIHSVLPGNLLESYDDLLIFLDQVSRGEDTYFAERKELCDWLYDHQDGRNCERLAHYLGL